VTEENTGSAGVNTGVKVSGCQDSRAGAVRWKVISWRKIVAMTKGGFVLEIAQVSVMRVGSSSKPEVCGVGWGRGFCVEVGGNGGGSSDSKH